MIVKEVPDNRELIFPTNSIWINFFLLHETNLIIINVKYDPQNSVNFAFFIIIKMIAL